MAQDIRDLLKNDAEKSPVLSKGHEARFEDKLNQAFSEKTALVEKPTNNSFYWLKVAAMIVLICSVGYFGFVNLNNKQEVQIAETPIDKEENINQISLGDISPGLKKMEDFYTNGINVQLASLSKSDDKENKELVEGYLLRFNELDAEYSRLTTELNKVGPTEETINALIDNLKLRLELLFKLKNKLKELKNQENEQFESIQS